MVGSTPHRYVIWDEAHHVEDVATSYFGGSITRLGVTRLLNRLLRQRSGRHTGLLPHIKFLLESEDEVNPTHKTRILEGIDDQAIPALISAEAAAVRFFARLNQLIEIKGTASDKVLDLPPTPGAFELGCRGPGSSSKRSRVVHFGRFKKVVLMKA